MSLRSRQFEASERGRTWVAADPVGCLGVHSPLALLHRVVRDLLADASESRRRGAFARAGRDIDKQKAALRPGVYRDMGLGEHGRSRNPLRRKLVDIAVQQGELAGSHSLLEKSLDKGSVIEERERAPFERGGDNRKLHDA